jgi:hypothetical protein
VRNDSLSYAGAESLAQKLRQYWLGRGYAIKTYIEAIETRAVNEQATKVFCVRSNLVNGLPPRGCEIQAAA